MNILEPEYTGEWSIICMNPYDFALEASIGPFQTDEEAVDFALNDSRCQEDWIWTVIPHQRPGEAATSRGGRINFNKPDETQDLKMNAIQTIRPYRHWGQWVFDDPSHGLKREPFVSGIPEIIDKVVTDIPDAKKGFNLLFSPTPFPGYAHRMERVREEYGGNWYYSPDHDMEGWLCPALFHYYDKAPESIYVKAEK